MRDDERGGVDGSVSMKLKTDLFEQSIQVRNTCAGKESWTDLKTKAPLQQTL